MVSMTLWPLPLRVNGDMNYLSVIVPVYNTSVYLERCLDSLVSQTFLDMEVILVDDGSTDCSGEICDRYAAKYSFVRCIHKCNGGLSSARNAGLDAAVGRYVAFVDSDDFISPLMFEKLCSASEEGTYDIVYCAIYNAWTRLRGGNESFSFDEVVDRNSVWKSLADMTSSPWDSDIPVVRNMAVWGAIFKRSVIEDNNIRFRSERELLSEDYAFDYELFGFVSGIRYIPDALYYYCLNDSSLSTTFLPSKISRLDSLIAFISASPIVCGHECLVPRIIKLDIYYSFVLLDGLVRSSLPVREKNILIKLIAGRNVWNNSYFAEHLRELGPSFLEMIRILRQTNLSVVRLMLFKRKVISRLISHIRHTYE